MKANDVLFRTERATIYSRLVEGRFPPYKEILPKKANARIPLNVGPFLTAVRQAAIMTDDESKRVNFHFAAKKVTLAAHGAAAGRARSNCLSNTMARRSRLRSIPRTSWTC